MSFDIENLENVADITLVSMFGYYCRLYGTQDSQDMVNEKVEENMRLLETEIVNRLHTRDLLLREEE